jgi:transcription termination factor Rho
MSSDDKTTAPPVPLVVNDLQKLPLRELLDLATQAGLRLRTDFTRRHLILDLIRHRLSSGGVVTGTALLERSQESAALRWAAYDLRPGPDDVTVPRDLAKKYALQSGIMLHCVLRLPRDREQGLIVEEILTIEGIPVAEWQTPTEFEKLTPLFPNRRVFLETPVEPEIAARAVDLLTPIGMGQRGLIAAPPRAGWPGR